MVVMQKIQKDVIKMSKDEMNMLKNGKKDKQDAERSPELATFQGLALRSKMGLKQGPEGSERDAAEWA